MEMAKKVKVEDTPKANFKARNKPVNGGKFTKGFVRNGMLVKFHMHGTKKVVIETPVPQKG